MLSENCKDRQYFFLLLIINSEIDNWSRILINQKRIDDRVTLSFYLFLFSVFKEQVLLSISVENKYEREITKSSAIAHTVVAISERVRLI